MPDKNTSVLNIYDAVQDYSFTSQDYFVHMLRFSQFGELCGGRNILDIGCGKHTNLLKAACMMNHGPQFKHYIGLDYGDITPWRQNNALIKEVTTLMPHCDFTRYESVEAVEDMIDDKFGKDPFTIVCFEVLEHMDFNSQCEFIYQLSRIVNGEDGMNVEACFFSTPNFNGSAAKNHISELHCDLLQEMFDKAGVSVIDRLGLSSWQKFNKINNLPLDQQDLCGAQKILNCLDNYLPLPLRKMVWGALLDSSYSNNILWTLGKSDVGAHHILKEELTNIDRRQK